MSIGRHRLKKSIKNLNFVKLDETTEVPGILGVTIGGQQLVDVPNREGYVYVRLRDNLSELIQAYNSKVTTVYDLPVLVYRDRVNKTRWVIKGRDEGRYANWGLSAYLPAHSGMHSFDPDSPGADIVWVYNQQFMPLLAVPSGSNGGMSVIIYPTTFYNNNNWMYFGTTGTISFASYKPTDNTARMVLITVDSNGNPVLTPGNTFDATLTGVAQIYQYIPDMPDGSLTSVAAIRLVSGTSIITWGNIYDVRQFFGGSTTGTSGGSGTDEKVKVSSNDTTAGYLNGKLVQGAGISLTELNNGSNETLRISFTGTVSGGSSISLFPNSLAFSDALGTINYNKQFKVYSLGTGATTPNIVLGTLDADTIPDGPDDAYTSYTLNLVGKDAFSQGGLGLYHYSPSPSVSPYITFHRSRGTETGTSVVVKNDQLGSIAFSGMGTPVGFYWGGAITAYAEETFNVAGAGTRLEFSVAPTGTTSYDDVILTLRNYKATVDGDVEINSGSAYYYGSPTQDGSWRTRRDAGTFVFEKRESGNWVNQTLFSGGAGSNLVVYDDNVYKVTGTIISFNDGLVVHVTGSVAYVDWTGSAGSQGAQGPPGSNTVVVYDNDTFKVTGTTLVFRDGLVVSTSGSIAYIDWTGTAGSQGAPGDNTLLLYDDNTFKVTGTAIHFNDDLFVVITGSSAWVNVTGVDISSDGADITAINFTEQSSNPAAPGAGHRIIFAKSDGIYMENSSGAVVGPFITGTSGGPDTDEKAKVSANDTTAGYLNGKLVQGAGISLVENNNGGNETLTIAYTGTNCGTYQRVGRPIALASITGIAWAVPGYVYASGSLAVYANGSILTPDINYYEQFYVSGTYILNSIYATGTVFVAMWGVPCTTQVFLSTGSALSFGIIDSNNAQIVDSNDVEIVDSSG